LATSIDFKFAKAFLVLFQPRLTTGFERDTSPVVFNSVRVSCEAVKMHAEVGKFMVHLPPHGLPI